MTRPVNRWTLMLAAGIVPAVICPAAMAAAGKVLAVDGSVSVAGSHARELKAGDEIEAGDIVVTQDGSLAHLLMADGSRIEVRASSRVRIDSAVLPSSVEHPDAGESKRTVGQSVATLLQGSVGGRSTVFAGNDGSVRELQTPYGKLAVAGARYSAEICEGSCADYAGQQGLRVAVDQGIVTLTGGADAVRLEGPKVEFVSAASGVAGSKLAASSDSARTVAAATALKSGQDSPANLNVLRPGAPDRSIDAQSLLGRPVDLINPDLPYDSRVTSAIFVPLSDKDRYVLAGTELSDMQSFNSAGNLMQFNAPFGSNGSTATYLAGTSSLLDAGRNGLSGIRWGRWAGGLAMISTVSGSTEIDLDGASLHWISGPAFEAAPQIPTSGASYFVLGGGTSPTDDAGHAGLLTAATLHANFTTQQVSAAVTLNLNGYNWFANGNGTLVSGTPRFNGAFSTVLIDGRIAGSGQYSGFFSAGALSPDQLDGAGISYWLTDDSGQFGTVYGVVAYVPGSPTNLGAPAVLRDVAYAVGKIDASQIAGGVAANRRDQLALNSSLVLTRFSAPVLASPVGVLSSGVASLVDAGQNTATGIRWGRWSGGAIDVTNASNVTQSNDISTQSLHWILGNEYGSAPVMPKSGTATYTLVGNTSPTDTLSHVGTLGSASFTANFTTRLLTSQLILNINGNDWYARGNATYSIGDNKFEGTYDDVRVQNLVRGQGTIYGFFTHPRVGTATSGGAGMSYNITDNSRQLGVISGVLAFVEGGAGATITPPAAQTRDVSFIAPEVAAVGSQVTRSAPADYALDSNFRLTSLTGTTNSGTLDNARYDIGTSRVMSSGVSPLVMLRWGRWSGGNANVTNLVNATSHPIDLSLQSLHWIEGSDAAPPVMPTFGTASYALLGATAPTDRLGNTGVLHNASLNANFTTQQVAASFDLTVNNVNVMATGAGNIGAAAGLQSHQFNGAFSSGSFSNSAATPQGSFSGFFTAPGGTQPGIPGGAGVTYSISDGLGNTVDGAAAFRSQ